LHPRFHVKKEEKMAKEDTEKIVPIKEFRTIDVTPFSPFSFLWTRKKQFREATRRGVTDFSIIA